jgi:acetylornithine/N-succinyldiaminopimelate aminotransferase
MSNKVKVDILTMAKGIAGGFPFGAFAFTEEIQNKLGIGDHGGTYCGNPLGCAVAYSVIKYMIDIKIWENVEYVGESSIAELKELKKEYPDIIKDVRGKSLLIAVELADDNTTATINSKCLDNGLILNVTQGNIIRMFPALNISKEEMEEGLNIFKDALYEFKER